MLNDEAIHREAGEEAKAHTQAIAEEAGATREKAMQVIAAAMNAGLRRKKPDLNVGLKGADMALRVHDAYPSEKHEVTHRGRLDHVHHMTDDELDEAINELEAIEADE